jgi:hypothetical protein
VIDPVHPAPQTRRQRFLHGLAACGICFLFDATAAESGTKWEFATGVDYSTGAYGNDVDTDLLYVPLTARARGEHLRFELTVPYMELDGPANLFGDSDGAGPGLPLATTATSSSGLGDIVVGMGYLLPRMGASGPFVEVKARAKIPTADEGLGTDEPDYLAQVEALQPLGDRLTLIAAAGYQWLGDPEGLELEDGLIGTLGVNLKAAATMDLGLLLDHRRRSFAGLDDQRNVVPYLSWRATPSFGLTAYGVFGLTDASPDYGGGLQFTFYP